LITGAGRRIGLALAHHFLNLRHPVIVSYRTNILPLKGYESRSVCIQADFSTDEGILAFAEKVKSTTTAAGNYS
jgi:dihydromonapterin reductase/dihydrofolate reductase